MNRLLVLGLMLSCPGYLSSCTGSSSSGADTSNGYWNNSCVTRDGRFLAAGGDHAVLIELSTGKVVEQIAKHVEALGCEQASALVLGIDGAWRMPGTVAVTDAPEVSGDVLAMTRADAWVSWTRTITDRKWRGPPTLFVTSKADATRVDLQPALFGGVGEAKEMATPDTFAVRLGTLLEDGRILAVAGWQPSQGGGRYEDVPWGFFAVNVATGEAEPLTLPLPSDAQLNQNWVQKVAATPDASSVVVAAHDGANVAVAQYLHGAGTPTRLTSWEAKGAAIALAISADGMRVAVGTESRGSDAPAKAWVIDEAGNERWKVEFAKTIVGLHFLSDGSLVVATAGASAVRVDLPAATEKWRTP